MALFHLYLVLSLSGTAQIPAAEGRIAGRLVNRSLAGTPAGSVEVLLRARRIGGDFAVVARTTTDRQGQFVFDGLPIESDVQYLPGAMRAEIYYPGPRIRLDPDRPRVEVELDVYDAITEPSPLVIRRFDVVIQPEPGALRVTETMLIENREAASYVGRPAPQGGSPVTLQLGVPPEFERVTFHEEFLGRRFAVIGGRLATSIPWTPGQRELKFHYVVRTEGRLRLWERPLDLPCEHVWLSIQTAGPEVVSCNLTPSPRGQDGVVAFESSNRLWAGYPLRVELVHGPPPFMAYARWVALAVLAVAIVGSGLVLARHRKKTVKSVSI